MIALMDRLLKRENLDLRLTVYRVLATASDAGLVEFVPSTTLSSVLAEHRSVLRFLARHNPDPAAPYGVKAEALENFVRSSAGYCVITYILVRSCLSFWHGSKCSVRGGVRPHTRGSAVAQSFETPCARLHQSREALRRMSFVSRCGRIIAGRRRQALGQPDDDNGRQVLPHRLWIHYGVGRHV